MRCYYAGQGSRSTPVGSNQATESLVLRFKGLNLYHEANEELVLWARSHQHLLSPLSEDEIKASEALHSGIPPHPCCEGQSENHTAPQTSGAHSVSEVEIVTRPGPASRPPKITP